MKKYIILVLLGIKSYGQLSPNKNYISVIKPREPISAAQIPDNNYLKSQEVKYFDGLGRNIQNVILGVTPLGKDLIFPIGYDSRGLKTKDYLPYPVTTNNNGAYSNSAINDASNFYSLQFPTENLSNGPTSTINPFSDKIIENSPLLRTIEIAAPGKDWRASNYSNIYKSPSYNYSWNYNEFVTGYVAGGSPINFNLNSNGLLTILFNFGGPEFRFNNGNIKYLENVPDAELGYIKNGGVDTSYFLSIKSGYLHISSNVNEPLQNVSCTFSYQFDKKLTRVSNGNTIKLENGTNKLSEVVRYDVELDSNRNPKLIYKDFYEPNQLSKSVVRDENWKPLYHIEWSPIDFKDLNGSLTGSNIVLDINKDVLNLTVNVSSYPWDSMKTGAIKVLDFEINDMNLGNLVDTYTNQVFYNVYIQKNTLYIKKVYTGTSYSPGVRFNTVLTSNILYCNGINLMSGTTEFRDFNDRILLQRKTNENQVHDTQYVYDIYGNLTYVIPPLATDLLLNSLGNIVADLTATNNITSGNTVNLIASNSITLLPGFYAESGSTCTASIKTSASGILNDLCYQYKYDSSNRLIEKKVPGKDWEYIVYDKLDRVLLTQDANLRTANKWLFAKYDAFNRPVYTGEYTNTSQTTRTAIQALVATTAVLSETKQTTSTNINNTIVYYSNNAFPNASIDLFTINYYDDYVFDLDGGISESSYTITPSTAVKTLSTGSKIRILGTSDWTTTVNYYDGKGRPIYTYNKNNYLATTNKLKTKLDFIGKTLETTSTHTRAGVTTTIVDAFTYDSYADRLLTHKQKINNQTEEVIVSNVYDELGQLISKGVGGKVTQSRLQTLDYNYNIRGWLKKINDVNTIGSDLFAFQLNYNDVADVSKKLYNGNISQTIWKTNNTDSTIKNYVYTYDALNRLTDATDNLNFFNESLSYDKNGNILTLARKGEIVSTPSITRPTDYGIMDNLVYSYDGNKLQMVSDRANKTTGFKDDQVGTLPDASIDYTYDANGNMKMDTNKGINAINYNHLNLPTQVTITGGTIQYIYDAIGVKQRKIVSGITTDYAGGFQYENNVLKFFPQPEGYAENNAGNFSYIYQYKDHLGNVRLSYQDKNNNGVVNSTEIVEESNYYAFGMKHSGYNTAVTSTNSGQKYKYNGKELQDELGLNFYDYGARNYDPAIGRWMNVDPLAEKYPSWSPYCFVMNTPINAIDPDGRRVYFVAGAGNDPASQGWNYKSRFKQIWESRGISDVRMMNVSHGKFGDMMFADSYRHYSKVPGSNMKVTEKMITKAVNGILKDLKNNPLPEGEQFNLAGYSYGSVLQAHVAIALADKGVKVDNLSLIGSPIQDDSDLMKTLNEYKDAGKIGGIQRIDIEGDGFSNPKSNSEYLNAVKDAALEGDAHHHFDLARPGKAADKKIGEAADKLKKAGVE